MAVAFGNITNNAMAGTASATVTFSHTATGSNLCVLICVTCETKTVSSCSYGGVSGVLAGTSGVHNNTYIYVVAAPPSGSNTVSVTFSASNVFGEISAVTLTGAHQTTPKGASTTASPTTPFSTSITAQQANSMMVDAVTDNFNDSLTANAGQTGQANLNADSRQWGVSTKPIASAGATTVGWTSSPSGDSCDQVIVEIVPAPVAGAIPPNARFGTVSPMPIETSMVSVPRRSFY